MPSPHVLRRYAVAPARLAAVAAAQIVLAAAALAQTPVRARNGVYVELLGNGGVYSINYDRRLGGGGASARVGLATWSTEGGSFFGPDEARDFWTVPLMLNALRGSGRHLLELGGGVVLGRQKVRPSGGAAESSAIGALTATAGYRYQRPDRGWLYRVGFTPFYGFGTEDRAYPDRGFVPSLGLSAGRTF